MILSGKPGAGIGQGRYSIVLRPMDSIPDSPVSDPSKRNPRRGTGWCVTIERGIAHGRIPRTLISSLLGRVGRGEKATGEVHLIVADNRYMRQLNRRFRNEDRATDVLAFPAGPAFPSSGETDAIGEVYCNIDHAREWSRTHGGSQSAELARLAVHGCLHLLGYQHHTASERRAMMARENRYLTAAGLIASRTLDGNDHAV
jgi:probable rRNA maturation factor